MTAGWRGTLLVALGWTIVGGAIALVGLRDVDDGARLLVVGATVTGPLLAVGAAVLLARQRRRGAGGLLVLSSLVTPTYAAWASTWCRSWSAEGWSSAPPARARGSAAPAEGG